MSFACRSRECICGCACINVALVNEQSRTQRCWRRFAKIDVRRVSLLRRFELGGVKRLMKEAAELRNPTDMYYAQPLKALYLVVLFKDNLFEWHFTVRGPADTDFDGGIYHGRILLPVDYPMKPPSVILLTVAIILLILVRTALLALIGFMPTHSAGALGSLEYPPAERKKLAQLSRDWVCAECGLCMRDALAKEATAEGAGAADEARRLASQISFKNEFDVKKSVNDENEEHNRGDYNEVEVAGDTEVRESHTAETSQDPSNAAGCSENRAPRKRVAAAVAENATPDRVVRNASMQRSAASLGFSWELIAIVFLSMALAALAYRRLSGAF
uniref:UBC core domain-containing protein n=1 Tax=Ascaris lumbricoides TaxID=6252 RepID=A0A9J2PTF4_ASCLU